MATYEIHVEQVDKFSKSFIVEAASLDEAERVFRQEHPDLDLAIESNALDDCEQTIKVEQAGAA